MNEQVRRIAIKVLAGLVLVLLLWPVLPMVGFCNPAEAAILGCFTPTYFLLLAGYLFIVLLWALIALWVMVRLDAGRLDALRRMIRRLPARFLVGFSLAVLGAALLRGTLLAGWLVLPASFAAELSLILLIIPPLAFGAAFLVVEDVTLEALEGDLAARLQQPAHWLAGWKIFGRSVDAGQAVVWSALGLMMVTLLVEVAGPQLWDQPLVGDASFHVYIGQHMLHGGIPYLTVIYEYSPVRFLVSAGWGLGSRLSGLPLVSFVRGVDLVNAGGILLLTYAIGQRLTGRRTGGLIAAALALGIEQMQMVFIGGPTFRLTAVVYMLLAVWLAQNRCWFWAAAVALIVGGLWPPGVVVVGAVGASALVSGREDGGWINLRAALAAAAGALVPLAAMAVALLIMGNLKEAFQQNVMSVWLHLTGPSATSQAGAAEPIRSLLDIRLFRKIYKMVLASPGDSEILALMGVGLLLAPFVNGIRGMLRASERAAPLLTALVMGGVVLYDYNGSYRDSIMLISNLTAFAALAAAWLFASPGGRTADSYPRLRHLLGGLVLGVLVLVGWSESTRDIEAGYADVAGSLSDQVRLAQAVNDKLSADDQVVNVADAWFLVLTGRNNAVAPRNFQYKMPTLEAADWTPARYWAAVRASQPVLIMAPALDQSLDTIDWLHTEYVNAGTLGDYRAVVFVRTDRADVIAVFSDWTIQP